MCNKGVRLLVIRISETSRTFFLRMTWKR